MTEDELLREVLAKCKQLGLLAHHCKDSRHCEGSKGFPDLVIAGPRGLVVAELKGEDGETSADQDWWLWMLHEGGTQQYLWEPSHWRRGVIEKVLKGLSA